jgi:hypothetical protein
VKRLLLIALVALAAACRKQEKAPAPAATRTAAGERLIDFDEKGGAFSCRAPAEWKAVEDDYSGGPLVMFLGPTSGPDGGTAAISVTRYPAVGDRISTPQEYLDMLKRSQSKPVEMATRQVGGRTVYAVHRDIVRRSRKLLHVDREDSVLVPCAGGFFLISHTAPPDRFQDSLPVFEAVVESFRPKS